MSTHAEAIAHGSDMYSLVGEAGSLALYEHISYNGRTGGTHTWVVLGVGSERTWVDRPTIANLRLYSEQARKPFPEGVPSTWKRVMV